MKRFLMLVAVAAVAGAMYVAAAPGSRQSLPPTAKQFAALKKQVATLQKSLTKLKKDEAQVKKYAVASLGFIGVCFLDQNANVDVKGVSQFGDPNGTYGFEYVGTAGAPNTAATPRTALDLDGSTTPLAYLQVVAPTCVSTGTTASPSSLPFGIGSLAARAERSH